MSGNDHCFVEWKEKFVSQERGNRVVHYFLKDSAGDSILAVVGTERSVRHMFYIVAEEFVKVYGAEHSIHVGFKWRSRREVVDWLTSMLSKQHLHGDRSKLLKHDEDSLECTMSGFSSLKTQVPDDRGCLLRNFSGHSSDIEWSGTAWTCGKQLKHYPAFCRNGTTIAIQSFVFVMSKGENRYVAYLEDMYEDKRGQKKVRVRWFHHIKEVKDVIPVRNPHPKEVFITPFSQVISAECVDGPATILTREHFEECVAAFPESFSVRVHLCSRQFRSNRVKPFDLRKLQGYFNQPIISCLNSSPSMEPDSISHDLDEEEEREPSPSNNVKVGAKRARHVRDNSGVKVSSSECLMMSSKDLYKTAKYGFLHKRLFSLKHVKFQPCYGLNFKVGEKIELLCQDSGIRGCWFRCTVLQLSRKQMKVQYDDVQDEDGSDNHLEEWVPAFKLAAPDKLGMRYSGRPTIRPTPPSLERELTLEVGVAVDAWWSNGWWEGVVTGVGGGGDEMQVYSPGENLFLNIPKKDLRVSRDWMGDNWIDIKAKPDVLSVTFAAGSVDTKLSVSYTALNEAKSKVATMSPVEIPTGTKLDTIGDNAEEKPNFPVQASPRALVEGTECMDDKELQLPKQENDGDGIDCREPSLNEEGDASVGAGNKVILHKLEDMGHSEDEIHENNTSNGHGGDGNNARDDDDDVRNTLEMECNTTAQNCNVTELVEVML